MSHHFFCGMIYDNQFVLCALSIVVYLCMILQTVKSLKTHAVWYVFTPSR